MTAFISSAFSHALGLLPFDTAWSKLVNPRMPNLKVALLITCMHMGTPSSVPVWCLALPHADARWVQVDK